MPITIPKEVQEFISGKMAWVATADKNGKPNLAPKGTLQLIDEKTLAFADIFSFKTREALEQNTQIAISVVDSTKPVGYQFKGKAELLKDGPLVAQVREKVKKMNLPEPACVVKISVEEIYSLTPGPDAGKKIV